MSRKRDSQKSKVYAWERAVVGSVFYDGGDFKRAEDAEAWLTPIWRKERGRVGLARRVAPKVERPAWGQRSALAHTSRGKITLPVWARSKWVVLHEAAHMLTPKDEQWHGPRFVGVLMGLACRWLDYDANQLMAIADEHGVKYHVRSIGVVPVHGTVWMLRKVLAAHEPMTAMGLASWISIGEGFDVNAQQVRAGAMQLIKAGEAKWFRGRLVPIVHEAEQPAAPAPKPKRPIGQQILRNAASSQHQRRRRDGAERQAVQGRHGWVQGGRMSYAPQVSTDSSGKFYGNALRFATREEAEANVQDLMMRWLLVRETRVIESTDPVNYAWVDGKLVAVEQSA